MNPIPNKVMCVLCITLLILCVSSRPGMSQDSAEAAEMLALPSLSEIVEQMREIGVVTVPGDVPLHVSAGHEARGAELVAHVDRALLFYEDAFGIRTPTELAVLDEADWSRVSPVPYGLPHPTMGSPSLVFLGATSEHEAVHDLRSRREHASAEDREKIDRAGLSWDDASGLLLDLVAFHELGHLYIDGLGIETHSPWFEEMLSSYFGYAFLREKMPEWADVWEAVLGAVTDSPRPAHTSLENFEQLYVTVGIPNYQWYQAAFQIRVAEVYDAQGIDFIHRVREAFPKGDLDAPLSTPDLLDALETLQPGFHAWAERLELFSNQ